MHYVDHNAKTLSSDPKNNSYYDNPGTKWRKVRFNVNKFRTYFILVITFFSILLPTFPGVQANYAFARPGLESTDNSIDENGNLVSTSKSKSKLDPNTFSNGITKENIITLGDMSDLKSSSAASSSAQGSSVQAQSSHEVYGDFNGDGRDDLAIRVPGEDVDVGAETRINAGAVNVLYGSSNGLSATSPRPDQFWTQSTTDVNDLAEAGDNFGASLSTGDFNGDGRDDLAIGVPFEDVDTGAGTIIDAGAVNVLYGSSNGLSATSPRPDQIWTQSSPDVNDLAEASDFFGRSLSTGDFNGDGRDDLAIGVPLEDVDTGAGTMPDAGAVNVLYGSSNGLSATSPRPDQFWTQSTTDVNDLAEAGDFFGASLSTGDFNGDGRDDLAIGVPFEDVKTGAVTIIDAGAVDVLYGSSNGLSATSPRPDQIWTQNTADVNDVSEFSDFFGASLSTGDFNGDGRDDLAIGVSAEAVDTGAGTIAAAGAVNVLYSSSNGLSATSPRPDQFWTQSTTDVNDLAEPFDQFGDSLSAGDFNGDGRDDLAIGVLGEDVDTGAGTISQAGAVNVLYSSSNGLSATTPRPDQFWTQSTPDVNDVAEVSDLFSGRVPPE